MSLTRKKDIVKRPAEKYIKWQGGEDAGQFVYFQKYDKNDERYSEKTKGENIEISIDGALILDNDLITITGFTEGRGYLFSNEVRSVEDKLTVRYFNEKKPISVGNWSEVKAELGKEGSFTKSVYLFLDGEIVNLQVHGAMLTSWFDDIENHPDMIHTHEIRVKEVVDGKKGNVKYRYPVFEFGDEFDAMQMSAAEKADEKLQDYLERYLSPGSDINSVNSYEPKEEAPTHNTSNWPAFNTSKGVLGKLSMREIGNLQVQIEEVDQVECEEYAMVCQAIKDYQDAKKSWGQKANKTGKKLEDFTLEELEEAYDKIMKQAPEKPARLYIEAGYCQRLDETEDDVDGTDIPF